MLRYPYTIMKNRKFEGNPVPVKLPSHLQIGDYCDYVLSIDNNVVLEPNSILTAGRVIKVHFSQRKVMYDLEFTVYIDHETKTRNVTRVHNVDSAFVVRRDDDYIIRYQKEYQDKILDGVKAMTINSTIWFGIDEKPKEVVPGIAKKLGRCGYSDDMIVDLDGTGKFFRVGWYDFDDSKWRFHDTEAAWTHDLKWTYLPI